MTLGAVLAVGLVGGAAAVGRVVLAGAVAQRAPRGFPYGTLAVNLLGAFLLGAVAGAALGSEAFRLAGTALLGSFTTFSTWMLEAHRLPRRAGLLNLGVSLVLGLAAVWLGRELGGLL